MTLKRNMCDNKKILEQQLTTTLAGEEKAVRYYNIYKSGS
jgi:hypothetical protein